MCAYNSFRGQPACGNDELLGKILRGQWGFQGYVVSDCGAVIDIHEGHKARATAAEGAAMALLAGTDLECGAGSWVPGEPDSFLQLGDAVRQGLVKEGDLDKALRRLFRAQMKLGVFDPPRDAAVGGLHVRGVVNSHEAPAARARGRAQGDRPAEERRRHAAAATRLGTVAVSGRTPTRCEVLVGNYSGTPVAPVTVLAGIKAAAAAAGTKVVFARGGPVATGLPDLHVVPAERPLHDRHRGPQPGLTGTYFAGHFDGSPVLRRVDASLDFDWADKAPVPALDDDSFSARWSGVIGAGDRPLHARRALRDPVPLSWTRSRSRRDGPTTSPHDQSAA